MSPENRIVLAVYLPVCFVWGSGGCHLGPSVKRKVPSLLIDWIAIPTSLPTILPFVSDLHATTWAGAWGESATNECRIQQGQSQSGARTGKEASRAGKGQQGLAAAHTVLAITVHFL